MFSGDAAFRTRSKPSRTRWATRKPRVKRRCPPFGLKGERHSPFLWTLAQEEKPQPKKEETEAVTAAPADSPGETQQKQEKQEGAGKEEGGEEEEKEENEGGGKKNEDDSEEEARLSQVAYDLNENCL